MSGYQPFATLPGRVPADLPCVPVVPRERVRPTPVVPITPEPERAPIPVEPEVQPQPEPLDLRAQAEAEALRTRDLYEANGQPFRPARARRRPPARGGSNLDLLTRASFVGTFGRRGLLPVLHAHDPSEDAPC